MEQFGGRVAVVTGAASGIGSGMVDAFAASGMRVVLADVQEEPLRRAERELLPLLDERFDRIRTARNRASTACFVTWYPPW